MWVRLIRFAWLLALGLVGLMAACTAPTADPVTIQVLNTVTPVPTLIAPTATPSPEQTPDAPLTITIWWPEALAPVSTPDAGLILARQIDEFQAAQPGILVRLRLKKADDVGGVMETLRSANAVAPGALPDLTLLRRHDLLTAVQAGLIQPLDVRISPAALSDLYPSALALGQVSNQLYGLAYMLETVHVITLAGDQNFPLRLDDLLAADRPFVFPAGKTRGICDVLLLQYLSAGGTLVDGSLSTVNADALRTVLSFYEEAVKNGIVSPAVLDYGSSDDYRLSVEGEELVFVTSSEYLKRVAARQNPAFGPIPVSTDQPSTVLDGWLWVMTTANPGRQEAALRFLNWMLDARRQAEYARVIHMLPAQRTALRQAYGPLPYTEFVNTLLANSVQPLAANGGTTARALQDALIAVISGERTAEEATQDVLAQLAG